MSSETVHSRRDSSWLARLELWKCIQTDRRAKGLVVQVDCVLVVGVETTQGLTSSDHIGSSTMRPLLGS